jgi:uncharacterized membrane protein
LRAPRLTRFANIRYAGIPAVDGTFVWLNITWLLFVSIIPFPTSLLGRFPLQALPITIYGIDLILANMTGFFVTLYLKQNPQLCIQPIDSPTLRRLVPIYAVTNGLYCAAIALALILPWMSYAIYAGVLGWLMIRYARIDNPFRRALRKPARRRGG